MASGDPLPPELESLQAEGAVYSGDIRPELTDIRNVVLEDAEECFGALITEFLGLAQSFPGAGQVTLLIQCDSEPEGASGVVEGGTLSERRGRLDVVAALFVDLPDAPERPSVAGVGGGLQMRQRIVGFPHPGEHQPEIERGHRAAQADGAEIGRFGVVGVALIAEKIPQAHRRLTVATRLGPPVRRPCCVQIAAPAKDVAEKDGGFGVPHLIRFPVGVDLAVHVSGLGAGGRPLHQFVNT